MNRSYEDMDLEELLTYGPPTVRLRQDDPELYEEADDFMDGTFSDHDDDWYLDFEDAVGEYLEGKLSLDEVRDIYAQVPVQNYSVEERAELQGMIGEDLYDHTTSWHTEIMDRLDISKWTLVKEKVKNKAKDMLFGD